MHKGGSGWLGGWHEHGLNCAQVDPQLLLALQQRFPSVPTLQLALADLVRKHANDRSLQVCMDMCCTDDRMRTAAQCPGA